MSTLALDIGKKKIGVAISTSGLIASELGTITSRHESLAIGQIIFLVKQQKVEKIIIGLPKNIDGANSTQTDYVYRFSDKLKNKLKEYKLSPVVIDFEDESLTSKEAERILGEQGKSLEQIKERTDQLSAKLILDQYLDRK